MPSPFVNLSRMTLLGAAWTGTAPGPAVVTPAGTITTPSDISAFTVGGGDPGWTLNQVDFTNYGSLGYAQCLMGIISGDDLVFDCLSDQAASQLRAIVITTLGGPAGRAPVYVDIKPTNAARGVANPSFVCKTYIKGWSSFKGNVGDKAAASLTLAIDGTFIDLTA